MLLLGGLIYRYVLRINIYSIVQLFYFLDDLSCSCYIVISIIESGVLRFLTIVEFYISPFNSINSFFMYRLRYLVHTFIIIVSSFWIHSFIIFKYFSLYTLQIFVLKSILIFVYPPQFYFGYCLHDVPFSSSLLLTVFVAYAFPDLLLLLFAL